MSDYSIQKIRKLPIKQRVDVICCFGAETIYKELYHILFELNCEPNPNYNLINSVLVDLFKNYNDFSSDQIKKIIKLKHIDLLYFIENVFCIYMSVNYNLTQIIHDILYNNQNDKNIKDIAIMLENFYIDISKNLCQGELQYQTCYLLENVPFINKLKLLDLLIKTSDNNFLIPYLKRYKINYPQNSIICQKIDNILNIYDIIV